MLVAVIASFTACVIAISNAQDVAISVAEFEQDAALILVFRKGYRAIGVRAITRY
jgi:hypothetical protein